MTPTILVTGATGAVGPSVLESLHHAGIIRDSALFTNGPHTPDHAAQATQT